MKCGGEHTCVRGLYALARFDQPRDLVAVRLRLRAVSPRVRVNVVVARPNALD